NPSVNTLTFIISPDRLSFPMEALGCSRIPFELDQLNLTHKMPFVGAVCVVESKNAAFINSSQMRHKKGKIVSDHLTLRIHPDLLAENTDASGTAKICLIIG